MILTIDIGNTRIKCAVFEKDTIQEILIFTYEIFFSEIEKKIILEPKINTLVIASVGKLDKNSFQHLEKKVNIFFIERDKPFPFHNKYLTPQTLGIDRMVVSAGAVLKYPDTNRLVIDAGTCVTYDFIDKNNNYYGGAISPGLRLRYEAMHNFTAKLPLLTKEYPETVIGKSTDQSIHSGIVNGLAFEIDGFINSLISPKQNFIIILTGGDAIFLAKRLKNTIFANSNFLLESLNHLYQYQFNNV